MSAARSLAWVLAALSVTGCDNMQHQENVRAYEPSKLFADGASARTPPGHTVSRDDPAPDCTLEGPAAGLYAFLWNRSDAARAGLVITGRPETVAAWNAGLRVRW